MECAGTIPGQQVHRRCPNLFIWLLLTKLLIWSLVLTKIGILDLLFGLIKGYGQFGLYEAKNVDIALQEHGGVRLCYEWDDSEFRYIINYGTTAPQEYTKIFGKICKSMNHQNDLYLFYNHENSVLCSYNIYKKYSYAPVLDCMCVYVCVRLLQALPGITPNRNIIWNNRAVKELVKGKLQERYELTNITDLGILKNFYKGDLFQLFFFCTCLSCFLMMCLHFVTSLVCYTIMIGVSIAAVVSTILLWWGYATVHLQLDNSPLNQILEESARNERALLTYAIIATIFTAILIFLVIYVRRHIAMVSELFNHAGACLTRHPALLLQPVITFFVLLAFFTLWVWVMASLATAKTLSSYRLHSGLPVDSPKGVTPLSVLEYDKAVWVRSMWWVWLIGLVWVAEFILACQQMIIASAVSTYYFGRQEGRRDGRHPVWWSWRILLLYHLGTVAKGSILITVFKLPRLIFQWITKKCKDPEHKCGSCCLRLCCCCLWIFENFLKYMNHNAYTVTATRGTAFCESARIAWRVVFTNMLQVATVNSVGDLTIFLAKVTVTAIVFCIALPVMAHDPTLHLYAVPLLLTAVFAFFITHCVFSVYEMAVDTLFLCFSDDYNTYDSTDGRELVADKDLYEFMVKHEDIDCKKASRKSRSREPPETIRFKDGLI
ncbi:unnamed protein product, partial [Meganyctiphanes norvegica]